MSASREKTESTKSTHHRRHRTPKESVVGTPTPISIASDPTPRKSKSRKGHASKPKSNSFAGYSSGLFQRHSSSSKKMQELNLREIRANLEFVDSQMVCEIVVESNTLLSGRQVMTELDLPGRWTFDALSYFKSVFDNSAYFGDKDAAVAQQIKSDFIVYLDDCEKIREESIVDVGFARKLYLEYLSERYNSAPAADKVKDVILFKLYPEEYKINAISRHGTIESHSAPGRIISDDNLSTGSSRAVTTSRR